MPKTGASSAVVKAHGGHAVAAQPSASAAIATSSTAAAAPAAVGSSGAAAVRNRWERTFSNGDSYAGEALYVSDKDRKPVKDGKGRYTWAASGAVYEGDWRTNQPHGSGAMRVPGADGYEYTGTFKDGKRSGTGRCVFANGRVYDGEWRGDEMSGTGTLRGATNIDDFVEYSGSFQEGKRGGQRGRCVYANGDIYDGAWAGGKRQGLGDWQLHRSATGAASTRPVRYRGPFDRDVPQACTTGEAEIEYADGSRYTGGTDANMRRNGKGVHRLASGDTFDGAFVRDRREGMGVLQGQDGAVCEGQWRSDQLDGEVRVTFAAPSATSLLSSRLSGNGTSEHTAPTSSASLSGLLRLNQPEHAAHPMATYQGPCVAGIFTGGRAVITYVDGSSYTGAVRNGVPHGPGLLRDRPLLLLSPAAAAAGMDAVDGVVRRRIPSSCVPADAQLTLTCYDGGFSNGEADGTGTGEWRAVAAARAGPPTAGTRVTPETFMRVLGGGLRCWDAAALYGSLDGTYTGQWVRGLPHGQGTWQWADGSRYSGAVAHYVPSSAGTLACGASVQYTGDLREGLAEGNGAWEDSARGLRFEGQWLAGMPHGTGVATVIGGGATTSTASRPLPLLSSRARVYDGMWADGKPAGLGREFADGDRQHALYEGSYVDGCREGEGTAVFDDADGGPYVQYKGAFRAGAPGGGGAGCLTLRNKTSVSGSFDVELLPVAHTEVVIKAGNEAWVFKGTYDAGTHTGRGTMSFATGDTYDGEVEDASCSGSGAPGQQQQQQQPLFALQRHGRGTYKFIEGNRLVCTWRHNVLHGAGTYTTTEGVQTERRYEDGVLTGDMPAAAGSGGSIAAGSAGSALRGSEGRVEPETGAVTGNIFTPENEFPNTLSEEALRARMPEQPSPTPTQSRKRQPFAFMRKGEARHASSAAAGALSPSPEAAPEGASVPAPAQRTSPHRDAKDSKRQAAQPAAGGAATAGTHQKRRSPRPSVTGTAPASSVGAAGDGCGGSALAVVGSSSTVTPSHATPKYSLRRVKPSQGGGAAPPPTTDAAQGSTGSSSSPAVSGRLSYMRRANESNGGGGGGTVASSSSSQSAYLSRFQAGIRQLDVEARANSPSPSTASRSPTPTTTGGGASMPATSPVHPGLRGRLSSALAAGRAQTDSASARPRRSLEPLQGSLKDLMDAASAIRSTREDEIHLLTEEMRCLNERIWQLRFLLAAKGDEGEQKREDGGKRGGPSARRGSPVYGKAAGKAKEEKRSPASKEALATLVQERRVIMEKLQYVVNGPEE